LENIQEHGNTLGIASCAGTEAEQWGFSVASSAWWYTYPSEKYEFVSWGYYSQSMEKQKCSKPPTRV